MRKHRYYAIIFLCSAAILTLILDSKTAIAGATDSISLCLQAVIPSLLPMMVLSSVLTDYLRSYPPSILKPLCRLLGVPFGYEGILIAGIFGGYPVGAACISAQYRSGTLAKTDAEHLLLFCSNAGPSFIFGICATLFSSSTTLWILWLIHIFSAMLASVTYQHTSLSISKPNKQPVRSLSQIVKDATGNMAIICGWIILFRIVIRFFQQWFFWFLPPSIGVTLFGILELTNGCFMLTQIADERIRFILCCLFINFGGICVLLQTKAVIGSLPITTYVQGKLVQAIYGILLSFPIGTVLFSNYKPVTKALLIMLTIALESILIFNSKNVIAFFKKIRYNKTELCRKR